MGKIKGFTLIELMIVIAIMGILAAIFFGEDMNGNTRCKRGVLYYVNIYDNSLSPVYDADTGEITRCNEL